MKPNNATFLMFNSINGWLGIIQNYEYNIKAIAMHTKQAILNKTLKYQMELETMFLNII
jgi:hypothetical protein